jgi:aminopeptidase N
VPVLERVQELSQCDFFHIDNPNNVYALLRPFFFDNPAEFHRKDGAGYQFWAQTVLRLNKINPQIAAGLARALENWRRYTPDLANLMYQTLQFMYARKDQLSANVSEIIEKSLNNPV